MAWTAQVSNATELHSLVDVGQQALVCDLYC